MPRFVLVLSYVMTSLSGIYASHSEAQSAGDADRIKRGQYLATAGDCVACHSAPAGKPYAGGLSLPTPLGAIVSTNITPSKTHGIGNYTLAQFTDALRKGERADGQRLYPAMPYTSYALVTDDDAAALYAYFMHGVAPVDAAPDPTALPFPFNIRLSMAAWNLLFLDDKPFRSDPSKSAEWNRGAYLSRGLAHCSACHTPRNFMMAEDSAREFGGGDVGTWYAPNITSDAISGIGSWNEQEIAGYLHSGDAMNKSQAAGPMAEAIDHSLRHLNDADLHAIAIYLKSVPPIHDAADTRAASSWGAKADDLISIRGVPLPTDLNRMTGPQLYDAHCATCHQAHAEGSFDGGLPSLFHNAALGRSKANNLVMVILDGVQRQVDPPELRMPGFAHSLSDQQIATLASYLTQRYGNPKAVVTADEVKSLRQGGAPSSLVALARVSMAVGLIVVIGLIFFVVRRRRRRST
ncbi:cytochrome c [Cupriavidus sp. D39]|uniref:cytochrome c n=1 Tax=Cupriavidus sp. D39 TaxID=2997877 RepID=UPI00226E9D74|nr:cytochrome c [Cupriavidus sp. D39]MCY0852953.1 cytochrome c [Cupriavidus sp. D39]